MHTKKKTSRRQFLKSSIAGTLAANVALDAEMLTARTPTVISGTQDLTLKVSGDDEQGYGVTILFKGHPVARHKGEFSAVFQNGERSLKDITTNWKASTWTGNAASVSLRGPCKLPNLNATVFVQVDYDVVTPSVVRKRMRFRQADMYMLFYQVSHRLEPLESPAKFWSFNQTDCQGGALHEYYPAIGFHTHIGLTVGLLTDCGYRNRWSRMIRRDGKPVKPAPDRIPDTNLNFVCRPGERAKGDFFVQQTFGEILARRESPHSGEIIKLPPASSWTKRGTVTVEEQDGSVVIATRSSKDGVVIPFAARDDEIYSLHVRYRSSQPFALQMWDVDNEMQKIENLSLYDDRVPESPSDWADFQTTVFFYSLRGRGGALFISMPQTEQATNPKPPGKAARIHLRGLEVRRLSTHTEPYHRLEMDRLDAKTTFVFVDEHTPDTVRGYRLSSQLHLADALGFEGGETEKVIYADAMMLSWIAGPEYVHPMLAPSIWYSAAGEMYLRDSFFALNGIHNRELNEGVFNLWAANQGADGAINTLVEPNRANLERKSNDSTPLWLVWALQNRRRFQSKLPMDKVRRAAEYCLRTYDRNHDGFCWAQFVMGQLDVINYPEGTTKICENQGVLAVTLRVIKELRIPGVSEQVSDDYIAKVEEGYRSYYDPIRKFIRPARHITNALGFGEIFPEFLSLWLFNRKLLTGEMVQNHLDHIPVLLPRDNAPYPEEDGTVRPIFIGLKPDNDWSYFTDQWHPMISAEHGSGYADHAMDGIYYNGGSWMRIEICGYAAGKLHGWKKADKAIANRLWAEINIAPDFPTSQEYLATDPAHPFFGYHRVFAWNSFVLQALELAGLRESRVDPDFLKADLQA